MAYSKNAAQFEARNAFRNTWQTPLSYTFCASPLYCCFTVICPWCAAYEQRSRTLFGDWSRYVCCGGGMPCSGNCGESNCPQFCLVLEVLCCFNIAVRATRFMIQDALQLHNTRCDNCIIGSMFCLQYVNCICSLVACLTEIEEINEAAIITDHLASVAYCLVCSCMLTQQHVELNKRDAVMGTRTKAPATQMMTRK